MRTILCLLFLSLLLPAEFLLHYQFEDPDANIVDSGPGQFNGVYTPSAEKDNDTPETSNPERYHQKAPGGRALGFFPELLSYAIVKKTPFPATMDKLHIALTANVGKRGIQYLVGNKVDSGLGGFSLMRWGVRWRFQYGDGQKMYRAEAPARAFGDYMNLTVDFTDGLVVIKENGREVGRIQTEGKTIAASTLPLAIGNYPSSNKKAYPAECFFDELIISDAAQTAVVPQVKIDTPPVRCLLEPVDGNEVNFNGERVLHSFASSPVTATFIISFEEHGPDVNPSLEWELPEGVTIPDVFRSTRKSDHKHYPLVKEGNVVRIPQGEFETEKKEEQITLVFDTAKDAVIRWRFKNGDKVLREDTFTVKLLPEMPPLPPGRFHSHSYMLSDIAFTDFALLDRVVQTYVRSGLIGKGRYYSNFTEQVVIDDYLRDKYGFILWEVSLWAGPWHGVGAYPDVPAALNDKGEPANVVCITALTRSKEAYRSYADALKKSLSPSKAVVLDFEPWGGTPKTCFCPECIKAFNQRFGLACENGTQIKTEHSKEWSVFWTEQTARYIKFMSDAAREALPGVEVWDYTYVFPYDDAEALHKRWWGIPKDPRLNEQHQDGSMVSLYHINGREAFELYDISRRHLKKQLCPISLISRNNRHLGHYTPDQDVLSPRQIYLKAIMTGAQGADIFAIYPGSWIDGAFHAALNQATTEVRQRESFYFDGKRRWDLAATSAAPADAWVATVHENAAGKKLATVINFSKEPVEVTLPANGGNLTVPAESASFREW
ncbi:MAG: hypothetical protein J5833_01820 [Victivallales bacterium]|nr:hypothetical protein [Victivallales bacterium]